MRERCKKPAADGIAVGAVGRHAKLEPNRRPRIRLGDPKPMGLPSIPSWSELAEGERALGRDLTEVRS